MPKFSKQHLLSAPERILDNQVPLENNIILSFTQGLPRAVSATASVAVTESSHSFKPTGSDTSMSGNRPGVVYDTRIKKSHPLLFVIFH